MPPKKPAASKKTVQKVTKKIVEDKTFGLKNKNKSSKVQKYVQTVQKQVDNQMLGKTRPVDKVYISIFQQKISFFLQYITERKK